MKLKVLLATPALLEQIRKIPPASKFSGKPLTLTHSGSGLELYWSNCMEPDWWVGMQDGVYTRQDSRPVTDGEILRGAAAAGLDVDLVELALAGRALEVEAWCDTQRSAVEALLNREALGREAAAKKQIEILAEREPQLKNAELAATAERELGELMVRHPHAVRMTRKLALIDGAGNKLAQFANLAGMRAWLYQHGLSPGIDQRHAFMDALK